ncbi:RNA-binding S4 domain-containing protein [Helicobacter sp. faydin-H20]|uniref:RNA-binding S4 domain-containing protein n=1 Tax=Helicobacter anatolicus TaxID=2905874 RepID=UPI001E4F40FB|nr:RNA-binding S4 domain-containing protein [Helicobacter anatolicus]MCE3036930.1 RNA-binding S4 domain-containing protein [Helicobacter anatolicus]
MRVDKFLNTTNIVKRRAIAQDMCDNQVVFLNGKKIKSSKEVKIGDIIEIVFLEKSRKFLVLALPEQKTIPKSQSAKYVQEIF